jgi:GPH family glycoside/pentoside/hexuronide:cation symporter
MQARSDAPGEGSHDVNGPISATRCVGYGVGMIGERLFRDAPALLLLLYMTDYLGIPAALAGIAIFVPKLWVVCLDPLVGSLSDRVQSRWGRRRPLMLVGAILSALTFYSMFAVPTLEGATVRAVYMFVVILLAFSAYSLYSVPYLTMGAEMSEDAYQRTRVMSYRIVFMAVGLNLSANAGGVVEWLGGGLMGYERMALLFAAICLLTMLLPVLTVRDVHVPARPAVGTGLLPQVRQAFSFPGFALLFGVGFAQKLAEGVGYASMAYFYLYVLDVSLGLLGATVLFTTAGLMLSQPLWLRASRRFGRVRLYALAVVCYAVVAVSWLAVPPQTAWPVLVLGLLSGTFGAAIFLMTLSLLADVMHDQRTGGGASVEGTYAGLWLAGEKVAFACGALLVGLVLSLFGFVESENGLHAAQSDRARFGIALCFVGIHALCYAVSLGMVVWYARRRTSSHLGAATAAPIL